MLLLSLLLLLLFLLMLLLLLLHLLCVAVQAWVREGVVLAEVLDEDVVKVNVVVGVLGCFYLSRERCMRQKEGGSESCEDELERDGRTPTCYIRCIKNTWIRTDPSLHAMVHTCWLAAANMGICMPIF
jgi:hypothetical protein